MATTNTLSQQLLDLLATRNFHPEMLDSQGNPTDAADAKTFSFDYISGAGKNYGTMVIVLDSDNEMKIMYGDNLGRTMEGDDKNEFFDFLQHLNTKATMNRWTHTTTDISQLKHTMQGLAAIQEGLFEGYYGNRKISYTGQPTEARLRIVHNQPLRETDARYHHIEKLFVETADGEVFKLGFRNLSGGKAMLEHVRQGGKPYDIRGCHITQLVNEIATLGRFNRASANRVLEGVTQELVTEAQVYYSSMRENLRRMSTGRGYSAYFENWHPADIGEQEELVENIKTLFIEQTLDTRIEAALPLLARIQQQGKAMKEADIFESWVNNLGEGTWELPETPEQQAKLEELMSQPLVAGPDGSNATEQLYDLVGDDVLFDIIGELAETDPDANIWDSEEVKDRLTDLGVYMLNTDSEEPATPDATAPAPAEEPPMAPVSEQINAMRKAAGLQVVESMLDEAGETLNHILDRFKKEVKDFKQGAELDSNLYDALFDYYMHKGEIPYEVAKAKTGDPYQWVSQRLDQEFGGLGFRGVDEADALNTFEVMSGFDAPAVESSCNHTMEGEYCPEHELAECGTTAGGMAPVVMGEMDKPPHDDAINYNAAITGSYYESKEGDAMLARMKSLALIK